MAALLARLSGGALFLLVFALLALLAWRTIPTTAAALEPPQAATDFAQAWASGELDRVSYDQASAPDVGESEGEVDAKRIAANALWMTEQISQADENHPVEVRPVDEPRTQVGASGERKDGDLIQSLEVTWDLGNDRTWTYRTEIIIRETDGRERVVWRPNALHPSLTHGLILRSRRLLTPRAPVLDAGRRPVGQAFAPALIGRTQPATHELAETYPARVEPGDVIGISGLQHVYDARLAGTAGLEVYVYRVEAYQPLEPWVRQVHLVPPEPGRPVQLSLDPTWQQRALAAVAGARTPTSLVAVNALTGEVIADANAATSNRNLALQGRYPPGSAFRPVTTLALARTGRLTTTTRFDCTPWSLAEQRFTSSSAASGPVVDLASAFAHGCPSGFARLAADLTDAELAEAASVLGFAEPSGTGVTTFDGIVPAAADDLTRVQNALGDGEVLTSPLALARVAATIASGTQRPPRLVLPVREPSTAPSPDTDRPPSADPDATAEGQRLGAQDQALLQQLMAVAVTYDGTLAPLRSARAGRVFAVAGTATGYGDPSDPQSAAWCFGYQGSIAFAVHVAGTRTVPAQGLTAARVAARFLG